MTPDDTARAVAREPLRPDPGPGRPEPAAPSAPRGAPVGLDVIAAVSLGGVLGAVARYAAGLLWPTATTAFPWTTFAVNVIGCLAIGCLYTAVEQRTAHRLARPFLGTGVLGGFTTFSTYCVDIERLAGNGHPGTAVAYLAATVVTALAAVAAGAGLTRRVLTPRRPS